MRRKGDRSALIALVVGAILVLVSTHIEWTSRCDTRNPWPILAAVLGAGMISPAFVTDLIKAWRKK